MLLRAYFPCCNKLSEAIQNSSGVCVYVCVRERKREAVRAFIKDEQA